MEIYTLLNNFWVKGKYKIQILQNFLDIMIVRARHYQNLYAMIEGNFKEKYIA